MLRLMRFGVYFKRILKINWLFSYRNTRIYALGARGHMLPEKILKIWCSLVRFGVYFIRLCLEKFPKNEHILKKKKYYSYTFAVRLVIALGKLFEKHLIIDAF